MEYKDSVIVSDQPVISAVPRSGLLWGFLGVLSFSFTVPFTRVAVETLDPLFVGAGRAVVAAALAASALIATRQHLPRDGQWFRLAIVAGGVVAGFPLLTSFAMTSTAASHGAVVIALLPATTAVMAVLRGRERPVKSFWLLTVLGALVAVTFAAIQAGGFGSLTSTDLLLFGAVIAAAVGYTEGGLMAREIGAWQTISWALVLASPVMLALTIYSMNQHPLNGGPAQWASFAYLGIVSMYLGFFAWYLGLGIGPMAQVSQIQLTQPVMSLLWAVLLLGEHLTLATLLGGIGVFVFAGLAVRVKQRSPIRLGR
ncbi:DMT family transporter [Kocuria sp. CPCC 205235]|uniref:DMT family transporter n=1 Tax=Kocuria TaxID=57493 RepID=UPI0021A8729D|nr:DMT family transporter [Kocuria carniphila]MCT1801822.1 DMT family transporter [Kocuria carniphila]